MLHGGSVQHSPPIDLLVDPVEQAVMQQLHKTDRNGSGLQEKPQT
jgi:hypothetical protein